jgi:hypothetical protein
MELEYSFPFSQEPAMEAILIHINPVHTLALTTVREENYPRFQFGRTACQIKILRN